MYILVLLVGGFAILGWLVGYPSTTLKKTENDSQKIKHYTHV